MSMNRGQSVPKVKLNLVAGNLCKRSHKEVLQNTGCRVLAQKICVDLRFVLLALCLPLSSCSSLVDRGEEPRIVWGEHIEGVRIGLDSAAVVNLLGSPTVIQGDDFEGGIFIYADDTKYDFTSVGISKDAGLGLGVIFMHVWPPYDGTTKDSVGLGTTREEALKYLPPPDTSYSAGEGISDIYWYEKSTFSARYDEDNKIDRIAMGQPRRYP